MPGKPTTLTLLAAGTLTTPWALATENPAPLASDRFVNGEVVAHIYYNPATGERVVTPLDWRPRSGSPAAWLNNNTDPCDDIGTIGLIDDPDLNRDGQGDIFGQDCATGAFPCEGAWFNFWGDIHPDTVVDCLTIAYGTEVLDVDTDSDSIGDGVVGFDLLLSFADNDDGFGASARSCILELTVPSLPGSLCHIPCGFTPVYVITIDLASSAPSLVFELGDSDGIDQAGTGLSGAAIYGAPTARDLDGDALHDFSYAMRFDQSALGTSGVFTETKGTAGYVTAAPKLGNPGDLPTHPADATGIFDAFDIYTSGPSCPPLETDYIGAFFHGGFTCEPPIPHASAFLELYSPYIGSLCPADLDGSGPPLDFTDVTLFLTDFAGPCTDAIGNFDLSSGGVPNNCDFSDVIAFLASFTSAQCGN